MTKKITAALLCLVLVLSLSGCSFAETVGNWLDSIGDMIPNDVELVLGQLTGREEVSAEHEIIFSEGYVNMLKSGVYHIVYSLSDGTEVEIGSNGLRFGSTYPEPAELEGVEPQYDENGNPIEAEIPHEHIVLSDGIYCSHRDFRREYRLCRSRNCGLWRKELPLRAVHNRRREHHFLLLRSGAHRNGH